MSNSLMFAALAAALLGNPATAYGQTWTPPGLANDAMNCAALLTAKFVQMGERSEPKMGRFTSDQLGGMAYNWHDEAWRRGGPEGPDHHEVGERIDAKIRSLLFGYMIGGDLVVVTADVVAPCTQNVPPREPDIARVPELPETW